MQWGKEINMRKLFLRKSGLKVAAAITAFAAAVTLGVSSLGGADYKIANAETNASYVDAGYGVRYVTGAPTVVCDAKRADVLNEISSDSEPPENTVITINDKAEAVSESGDVIGGLASVIKQYILNKSIPVVRVETEAAADAFIAAFKQSSFNDLTVLSSNGAALKKIRSQFTYLRGAFDGSKISDTLDMQTEAGKAAALEILQTANSSMANIVVLSAKQTNKASVEFFQYRFKAVWACTNGNETAFAVKKLIVSGAYGIILDDYVQAYSAYSEIKEGLAEFPVFRAAANIAHRGLPFVAAENSFYGYQKAIEYGATHIEADVRLTKDKRLVIMHDGTLTRTTDYTGNQNLSDMTLAEIKQNHIIFGDGKGVGSQPIPTLEETIEGIMDTSAVLILELKSSESEMLPLIRAVVEEYDFWDRIVFISFYDSLLAEAYGVMPEIPTASLNGITATDKVVRMEYGNSINASSDANLGAQSSPRLIDVFMKNRGFLAYLWTYGSASAARSAMSLGAFGLTNNEADVFGRSNYYGVSGVAGQVITKAELQNGAKVTVEAVTYDGVAINDQADVFAINYGEKSAEVIASYIDYETNTIRFTEPFTVNYEKTAAQETKKGCKSSAESAGVISLLCSVAFAGTLKRKVFNK